MKMFTFVALAALTLRCFAQQNTGPQVLRESGPEAVLWFDVASVKQCKGEGAGRAGRSQRSSPGRIDLTCASLADLIHIAYDQNAPNRPVNEAFLKQQMATGKPVEFTGMSEDEVTSALEDLIASGYSIERAPMRIREFDFMQNNASNYGCVQQGMRFVKAP